MFAVQLCQNPQAQIQPVVYGTIDHVLEIGVNTGEEEKVGGGGGEGCGNPVDIGLRSFALLFS